MAYNPDQPRDERGRWGEGGGGLKTVAELRGPRTVALGNQPRLTGPKLTKFDSPDVLEARDNNRRMRSTHEIKTPERMALRKEVEDKLYGTGAKNKDREAYLVIGGPGSGKSSLAERFIEEHGALEIDADLAKTAKREDGSYMLPEFAGGSGASAVHEESSEITGHLIERAIVAGDNIVLPAVGKSEKSVNNYIGLMYAAGYKVHLVDVDVDPDIATERALKRWRRPDSSGKPTYKGRFVDPNYILNQVGTNPRRNYEKAKRHEGVYSYSRYDNNGRYPQLVERGRGPASRRR